MAQKRKGWNGLISGFKASDLVFLDEGGCNTDMTRRYTYSPDGSRAVNSGGRQDRHPTSLQADITYHPVRQGFLPDQEPVQAGVRAGR